MEESKDSSETEEESSDVEEEEKSRNWADQVEESSPTMVVKTSEEPVEEREKEKVKTDKHSIVKRFGLFTARGLIPEDAWEEELAIDDELFDIGYYKWKKDVRMLNREFHCSTFSKYSGILS